MSAGRQQQIDSKYRSGSLATKLTRLYGSAGTPPSDNAVADGIFAKTGVQMSAPYLCLLRTGKRTNPTVHNLQAIAEYFCVPTSYLIEAHIDSVLEAELEVVRAMHDTGIRDIATRLSGLAPETIGNLTGIIDRLRELENLPAVGSYAPHTDAGGRSHAAKAG